MNFPTYLWHGDAGRLYLTDSMNFRVQWFSLDGAYGGAFGRMGDVTGSMSRPKGVATDRDGHVYVVDALHAALQVFDPEGRLLYTTGEAGHEAGEFWLPSGLWVDGSDRIYVADTHNHRIQVLQYVGATP
jgi:sugar lactone lactonase YvrE